VEFEKLPGSRLDLAQATVGLGSARILSCGVHGFDVVSIDVA
jgi:hypothetical protein